jgi:hypothetical protein
LLHMLSRSAVHDPSIVTDALGQTKYRDARRAGAHESFLNMPRGFLKFGGFPNALVAALQADAHSDGTISVGIWRRFNDACDQPFRSTGLNSGASIGLLAWTTMTLFTKGDKGDAAPSITKST